MVQSESEIFDSFGLRAPSSQQYGWNILNGARDLKVFRPGVTLLLQQLNTTTTLDKTTM